MNRKRSTSKTTLSGCWRRGRKSAKVDLVLVEAQQLDSLRSCAGVVLPTLASKFGAIASKAQVRFFSENIEVLVCQLSAGSDVDTYDSSDKLQQLNSIGRKYCVLSYVLGSAIVIKALGPLASSLKIHLESVIRLECEVPRSECMRARRR